jgi:hypothetical protein
MIEIKAFQARVDQHQDSRFPVAGGRTIFSRIQGLLENHEQPD